MDLISRQAALKACRNPEYGENCYAYGDDIEKRLKSLPPVQPGWIPVTERLPKDDGDYLVTKKSFGWNCKEYIESDIARYENKDGWHKADTVLAWMPLPTPYREGGQS